MGIATANPHHSAHSLCCCDAVAITAFMTLSAPLRWWRHCHIFAGLLGYDGSAHQSVRGSPAIVLLPAGRRAVPPASSPVGRCCRPPRHTGRRGAALLLKTPAKDRHHCRSQHAGAPFVGIRHAGNWLCQMVRSHHGSTWRGGYLLLQCRRPAGCMRTGANFLFRKEVSGRLSGLTGPLARCRRRG